MTSFSGDQSIFLFLSFEPIVFAVQPTLTQFFNPLSINSLFWVFWAQARLPFGFYWRKKRECSGPIGILPTQVQARLWCQCKDKAISIGRLGIEKVLGIAKNPAWGKLGPNWEGPYRITLVAGIGAYFLEDLDEHVIPRPWNVNNLKMYYY